MTETEYAPVALRSSIVLETASVVIDVNDIAREAAFWSAVLGGEPGPLRGQEEWITVGSLDATTHLVLQKVPEGKVVKNRCHLCFVVTEVDDAARRIRSLGGCKVSGPRTGGGVTMADPEGNEFCIGAFRRTKDGKRTAVVPAGVRGSSIDRVV